MTILSTIQRAATKLGLDVPATVFASTEREHVELADAANDAAEAIAKAYDWQTLKVQHTLTGDGSTEDFDLPADYARMLLKTKLWVSSRPFYPLEHVTDSDTWLGIVTSEIKTSLGQWTIYGDQIHIRPALANADEVAFFYISNKLVKPASGDNKTEFSLDTDSFRLSERLLRLGIIWQWKKTKGQPYAEDMADYEIALAQEIATDKGSKLLTVGTQRVRGGVDSDYAFPGTVTV